MKLKCAKRLLPAFIVLLMLINVTTGCTKKDEPYVDDGKPITISIMLNYFSSEAPKAGPGSIHEKLEEMTNTKLDITWIPAAAYDDRSNVSLNTGSLPMVTYFVGTKDANLVQAARSNVFWEIGPYINKFENLKNKDETGFVNTSIDGKYYAIYCERNPVRRGVIYRADWLRNVGLEPPKTMDDLYNMFRAFTFDDPNKSGNQDTIGVSDTSSRYSFDPFVVYMGGPNVWKIDEDQKRFVYYAETKEYLDAMNYYKRLFEEKILNQDFPIVTNTVKAGNVNKGLAGAYMTATDGVIGSHADLYKNEPDAEMDFVVLLEGPNGEIRTYAERGFNGGFYFSKSSIKSEAHLLKVLSFFNRIHDKDVEQLLEWGFKGRHYDVVDGVKVRNAEQDGLANDELQFSGLFHKNVVKETYTSDLQKKVVEMQTIIAPPYKVSDPSIPLISEFETEVGDMQTYIIEDARVKYIMGYIDEAEWNELIEEWKNDVGIKWGESLYKEYKK